MTPGNPPLLSRRAFIHASSATAAVAALGGTAIASVSNPTVGIQLYTVQSPLASDLAGTLERLRQIGYRDVETLGLLGHSAKEFRAALDKVGLQVSSSHVISSAAQTLFVSMATGKLSSAEAWGKIVAEMDISRIESTLEDMFEQSESLGNRYLVLSIVNPTLFTNPAGMDKVISAFTKAGDLCHARGLKFAFHPEVSELAVIDGVRAADIVLKHTNPERVFVELDFFWAAAARVDIPRWLEAHDGRVHLGHIKDMAKGFAVPPGGFKAIGEVLKEEPFEDIGYGQLDYRTWVPLAKKAGMRHFFVERDISAHPLESVARSFPNLKHLLARDRST